MQATYQTILAVHILASMFSVVYFWIPAFAKKGSALHVRAGKLYVAGMIVLAVTALALCALNVADPIGVGSMQELRARRVLLGSTSSGDTVASLVSEVRLNATWLAYLAVLLLTGVRFGTQVIRTRGDHDALRNPLDVAISGALVVSGPAMIAVGLLNGHPLITTFGVWGLMNGSTRLAFMLRAPKSRMGWFYQHMSTMLGTGVSLHAAMLLAVGRHLPGPAGTWRLLPATLVIIGIPAMAIWKRYYRNRFEPTTRKRGLEAQLEHAGLSQAL